MSADGRMDKDVEFIHAHTHTHTRIHTHTYTHIIMAYYSAIKRAK